MVHCLVCSRLYTSYEVGCGFLCKSIAFWMELAKWNLNRNLFHSLEITRNILLYSDYFINFRVHVTILIAISICKNDISHDVNFSITISISYMYFCICVNAIKLRRLTILNKIYVYKHLRSLIKKKFQDFMNKIWNRLKIKMWKSFEEKCNSLDPKFANSI